MSRPARLAAAALAPAALLALLLSGTPAPTDPPPEAPAPAVVISAAAPDQVARRAPASPRRAVRRALAWQLAAEAGRHSSLPAGAFTDALARELIARPPRPAPDTTRGRLLDLREQDPIGEARRVLATIRRRGRREHLTVLLVCRPACRVASIE